MRQRRIKNLEEKLEACRDYIVYNAEKHKGVWRDIFPKGQGDRRLFMELGCGKGAFISELSKQDKDDLFLGFEVQPSAVAIAGRKLLETEPKNVKLVNTYVDSVEDIFQENELDGIYLNFSDPWPKKRHEKRRLTHRNKLRAYKNVVRPRGFLEIKTDNDLLFDFTVEEIEAAELHIDKITRDLHNSEYMEENILTEYEEKFSNLGKNIYYIRVIF